MKVKCFGMVAEALKSDVIELNVSKLSEVEAALLKKTEISNLQYRIAVNHELVSGEMELTENDEVAILPPFAGG